MTEGSEASAQTVATRPPAGTPRNVLVLNAVILIVACSLVAWYGFAWQRSLPSSWEFHANAMFGSYHGVATFPSGQIPDLRPRLAEVAVRSLVLTLAVLAALQVLMLLRSLHGVLPSIGFMAVAQILIVLGGVASCELQMHVILEPLRGVEFMYPDAVRHWRYNPAVNERRYVVDSHGLRGLDITQEKQPNEFRILCLGDSISAGHELDENQCFTWLLQAYLRRRFPQLLVRVKNGAANGYSAYQNIEVLREIGDTYRPDLIVCEFTHANHEIVQMYESGLNRYKIFRTVREWLFRSDFYLWARRELNSSQGAIESREAAGRFRHEELIMDGLRYMRDYGRQNGVQIVFYVPYARGPIAGVALAVPQFAQENGIPYVDLGIKWSRVPNLQYLLQDHCHPNVPGAMMQATDVGDFLIESGLIPGSTRDPAVTPTGTPYPADASPTPVPVPPGTQPATMPPQPPPGAPPGPPKFGAVDEPICLLVKRRPA